MVSVTFKPRRLEIYLAARLINGVPFVAWPRLFSRRLTVGFPHPTPRGTGLAFQCIAAFSAFLKKKGLTNLYGDICRFEDLSVSLWLMLLEAPLVSLCSKFLVVNRLRLC